LLRRREKIANLKKPSEKRAFSALGRDPFGAQNREKFRPQRAARALENVHFPKSVEQLAALRLCVFARDDGIAYPRKRAFFKKVLTNSEQPRPKAQGPRPSAKSPLDSPAISIIF
jgi:hypothetical protein